MVHCQETRIDKQKKPRFRGFFVVVLRYDIIQFYGNLQASRNASSVNDESKAFKIL